MIGGRVQWWEVRVTDVERATAFYTAVLGATTQPFEQYTLLLRDGEPIGALELVEEVPATDGYLRTYFDSDDLEGDLAAIEAAGGSVEHARGVISPEFGWWALARDPFGNWLGLTTSRPPA